MPSIRKNRTKIILQFLIFCFIWLNSFTPNSYCLEDNPYCAGDEDRIQKLTQDFIEKYGEGVNIYWDKATGWTNTIAGIRTEIMKSVDQYNRRIYYKVISLEKVFSFFHPCKRRDLT